MQGSSKHIKIYRVQPNKHINSSAAFETEKIYHLTILVWSLFSDSMLSAMKIKFDGL